MTQTSKKTVLIPLSSCPSIVKEHVTRA